MLHGEKFDHSPGLKTTNSESDFSCETTVHRTSLAWGEPAVVGNYFGELN